MARPGPVHPRNEYPAVDEDVGHPLERPVPERPVEVAEDVQASDGLVAAESLGADALLRKGEVFGREVEDRVFDDREPLPLPPRAAGAASTPLFERCQQTTQEPAPRIHRVLVEPFLVLHRILTGLEVKELGVGAEAGVVPVLAANRIAGKRGVRCRDQDVGKSAGLSPAP